MKGSACQVTTHYWYFLLFPNKKSLTRQLIVFSMHRKLFKLWSRTVSYCFIIEKSVIPAVYNHFQNHKHWKSSLEKGDLYKFSIRVLQEYPKVWNMLFKLILGIDGYALDGLLSILDMCSSTVDFWLSVHILFFFLLNRISIKEEIFQKRMKDPECRQVLHLHLVFLQISTTLL